MIRLVILTSFLCNFVVWTYPWLRDEIPNGYKVPLPQCDRTLTMVLGMPIFHQIHMTVGHAHFPASGDPALNRFGQDYKEEIFMKGGNWSTLCRKDSDGDGLTNGEELGDKNCTWTPGTVITYKATSHPGFNNNCSQIFV